MRLKVMLSHLVLILGVLCCEGQPLHQRLFEAYESYREPSISTMRFKQADILPLLDRLENPFEVSLAGRSVEDRPIQLVKLGSGPVQVLLWSQMHGNEPTATMALMDIFNFFQASGDGFDAFRQDIRSRLTLYFIPMLNPDGAERFQRRNRQGIDLNRDALRLQTPEARILKRLRDEIDPEWGFNLHDQSRYYAAGNTGKQAGISFLAPAYNVEKDINPVRERSIRLIGLLNDVLQLYIPDQVARYNDDFEPRAFGDNIQKWGTSTILIESGGLPDDPEKQRLRKLHFVALLAAFDAIAAQSYREAPMARYESIPINDFGDYHDLILREVQIGLDGMLYEVDIAFRRDEVDYNENRDFYYRGRITDIGDLSTQNGYREIDAKGYRAVQGKAYDQTLDDIRDLNNLDILSLVKEGYTDFVLESLPEDMRFYELPVRLLLEVDPEAREIRPGANPSLLLEKDGTYPYAIINGRLYDLSDGGQTLVQQWNNVWNAR